MEAEAVFFQLRFRFQKEKGRF